MFDFFTNAHQFLSQLPVMTYVVVGCTVATGTVIALAVQHVQSRRQR